MVEPQCSTVAVMAPNIPPMLEAHYGVPMCKAVLNTLNTRLDAAAIALAAFANRYDSGIKYVETISTTFRTATGRRYGPEFIDMGLSIAHQLKPLIDAEIDGAGPP